MTPAKTTTNREVAIRANHRVLGEQFTLDYARLLARFVVSPIAEHYFRARLIGFDDFPERNDPNHPLIFVGNHSGMAFPWDAITLLALLTDRNQFRLKLCARPLVSPLLTKVRLMNPFLIPDFWRRAGGVDATRINFETVMHFNESNVMIYPEGIYGIGKGFNRRYQLQRLSTSALHASLKYQTDIIPIATINGEYINPISYSLEWINRLVRRVSIPFLPLGPLTLLILVQPWIFYFAMPARLLYVRGRRLKPYQLTDKPYDEMTQEDVYALRDRLQTMMQHDLDLTVRRLGQQPYDWKGLWRHVRQNWRQAACFLPPFWAFMFAEHERRYQILRERHGERFEGVDPEEVYRDLLEEELGNRRPSSWRVLGRAIRNNWRSAIFYVPLAGLIPMFMVGYGGVKKRHPHAAPAPVPAVPA